MAVRQYVGARYVPKFYQNTQNPLYPTWEGNKSYEALTIVSYNNDSYTSKIPVPAGIGNPADNPTYWVCTGNYNAQVEQYRQTTVALNENVNQYKQETEDAIDQVDEKVKNINDTQPVDAVAQGIDNTGTTDVTSAIATLLTKYNAIYFPAGKYKITSSGTYNFAGSEHNVCIKLPDNAHISASPDAVFVANATVFLLGNNCEVEGGSVDMTITATTRELYGFAYVAGVQVKHCHIHDFYIKSQAMHGAIFNYCEDCKVTNITVITQNPQCGSSILFFGGNYYEASSNSLIGGTGDGDLSCYNSNNAIITNNLVTAYADDYTTIRDHYLQGITIDAGAKNCVVSNNKVWGYFYGIDSKSSSIGTLIIGNDVFDCKVCIANRIGELQQINGSTSIIGNNVHDMTTSIDGNIGDYNNAGIWVQNATSCLVSNNNIYRTDNSSEKGTAIVVTSSNTAETFRSTINIASNIIGSYYLGAVYNGFNGIGIYVSGVYMINVNNNSMNLVPGAVDFNAITIANVTQFICNGNQIYGSYAIGIYAHDFNGGSINNNMLINAQQEIKAEKGSNLTCNSNSGTYATNYVFCISLLSITNGTVIGNVLSGNPNSDGINADSNSSNIIVTNNCTVGLRTSVANNSKNGITENNLPAAA